MSLEYPLGKENKSSARRDRKPLSRIWQLAFRAFASARGFAFGVQDRVASKRASSAWTVWWHWHAAACNA